MSKMRINHAIKHSVPTSADFYYQHGDKVLVWRENIVNNLIG